MSAGQFRTLAKLLAACSATALAGCATGAPPEWTKIDAVNSPVSTLTRTDGLYGDAVASINRRDYAAALEKLHAARQAQPGDARVLNALGVVYDKLGRFDLSQRYYAQASQADPSSPIVQANLAYSRSLQSRGGAGVVQLAQAPVLTVATPPAASNVAPQSAEQPRAARQSEPAPSIRPVVADADVVRDHAAPVQAASRPGDVRLGRTGLFAELTTALEALVPANLRDVAAPIASGAPPIHAQLASNARPQRRLGGPDPVAVPVAPPEAAPAFARSVIRPAQAPATVPTVLAQAAIRPVESRPVAARFVIDPVETAAPPAAVPAAASPAAKIVRIDAPRAPVATGFRIAAAPAPRVVAAPSVAQARARQASYAARTGRAPLMIVNATGQWRRGEDVRASLAGLGWSAPRWAYASQSAQARSVIYYPANRLPIARALASTLPGKARLVACDRTCPGIQLVLGADARFWKVRGA